FYYKHQIDNVYTMYILDNMNTKIKKWGNSFGVRIPKNFVDDLKLENADVSVYMVGSSIVIEPIKVRPVYTLEEMVEKMKKTMNRQHPFEDWGEVGEEIVEWNEEEAKQNYRDRINSKSNSKNKNEK
ncbi:MAG: AbrB/MazE/SpoVT family DNA-binding domain-containing protein, partial [bacterium]